jgi:hypothetical protein
MNSEHQDFQELRRLLAVKQHEQPPPEYFRRFPNHLRQQLEAEPLDFRPWWQQWFAEGGFKPLLACAYGMAVVSLMFFGLRLSLTVQDEPVFSNALSGHRFAGTPELMVPSMWSRLGEPPGAGQPFSLVVSSVHPVFSPLPPSSFLVEPGAAVGALPASLAWPGVP